MKRVTNIEELKQGDKIAQISRNDIIYWEFLMVHPHNPNYVLMIESLSQNALKLYIPNILDSEFYQDYTIKDMMIMQVESLKRDIQSYEEAIAKIKD